MPPMIQKLFLAAAFPLAELALGQTIEVGGKSIGTCLQTMLLRR